MYKYRGLPDAGEGSEQDMNASLMSWPTEGIRRRWRRWVDRRIARSDHSRFGQHNIFIVPSGAGLLFCGLLVVMLLTGINYQNSLIYLLTFLLGTFFFLSIVQTYQSLAGLELIVADAGEGPVGAQSRVLLRLVAGAERDYPSVMVIADPRHPVTVSVEAGASVDIQLPLPLRRRGPLDLPRLRIETRFPFGLLKAWSWGRPLSRSLAWPAPLPCPPGLGGAQAADEGVSSVSLTGVDWIDLRPYREGDPLQRVQWKRFARAGDMVSADWQASLQDPDWLDFDAFVGVDAELRLNYLAHLIDSRDKVGKAYGLKIGGHRQGPGIGPAHRLDCLRLLAWYGFEGVSNA